MGKFVAATVRVPSFTSVPPTIPAPRLMPFASVPVASPVFVNTIKPVDATWIAPPAMSRVPPFVRVWASAVPKVASPTFAVPPPPRAPPDQVKPPETFKGRRLEGATRHVQVPAHRAGSPVGQSEPAALDRQTDIVQKLRAGEGPDAEGDPVVRPRRIGADAERARAHRIDGPVARLEVAVEVVPVAGLIRTGVDVVLGAGLGCHDGEGGDEQEGAKGRSAAQGHWGELHRYTRETCGMNRLAAKSRLRHYEAGQTRVKALPGAIFGFDTLPDTVP